MAGVLIRGWDVVLAGVLIRVLIEELDVVVGEGVGGSDCEGVGGSDGTGIYGGICGGEVVVVVVVVVVVRKYF